MQWKYWEKKIEKWSWRERWKETRHWEKDRSKTTLYIYQYHCYNVLIEEKTREKNIK